MEISIERKENGTYTVTAGNKPIITTWLYEPDLDLKIWIRKVRKVYCKGKHDQNLVVGFSADRSLNYSNGTSTVGEKGSRKDHPFELLQLCVGSHCLLYALGFKGNKDRRTPICPKALKDFFYDRETTFVGVEIEQKASKLEREFGFLISNKVELRDLAKAKNGLEWIEYARYSVERLARVVLGEEFNVERPNKIQWWNTHWAGGGLHEDMVKYATIEAFLAYEMGFSFFPKKKKRWV